jgi:hypothetical protein
VQNYIYWLISTENDHRHHHIFIKYEKRLRKEGNMLGLPINNNQALPRVRSILETINNMWFLGKRETVNAWKKADFDGFRDKEEFSLCWPLKICVCLPRKYGRFMLLIDNNCCCQVQNYIWNKCRIYVGDQLDRCRWMERTRGSAWLLLIGKPSMLPSFLKILSSRQ